MVRRQWRCRSPATTPQHVGPAATPATDIRIVEPIAPRLGTQDRVPAPAVPARVRVLVEFNQFWYWLAFLCFRPCLLDARGAGVYSVVPQFLTERSQGETEAQSGGARRRGQARGLEQARGTRRQGRALVLGGTPAWVSGSPTRGHVTHLHVCATSPPLGEGATPLMSSGRRGGGSEFLHTRW
jgi:hypothetical protein